MLRLFAAAVAGFGIALGAVAAEPADPNSTLGETNGRVAVSQGNQFAPAKSDMRLKPGDLVRTRGRQFRRDHF